MIDYNLNIYSATRSDSAAVFYKNNIPVNFIDPMNISNASVSDAVSLVETDGKDFDNIDYIISVLNKNNSKVIATGPKTSDLEKLLFRSNVVRYISSENIKRFPFSVFVQQPSLAEENFAILDTGSVCKNNFEKIMQFYNQPYKDFYTSEELFHCYEPSKFSAIFININSKNFDLVSFIKSSLAYQLNLNTPIIPYADKNEGVDSSAIRSGLNRVAKVILNYEETISFIVHYIMKKEMSSINNRINSGTIFECCNGYSEKFSTLYFNQKDVFFKTENPFPETDYREIYNITEEVRNIMYRQMQVEWLTDLSILQGGQK